MQSSIYPNLNTTLKKLFFFSKRKEKNCFISTSPLDRISLKLGDNFSFSLYFVLKIIHKNIFLFVVFTRMWFHRPIRADDWLLFMVSTKKNFISSYCSSSVPHSSFRVLQITSPSAFSARGYVSGQMFNRKGEVKFFLF